LGAACHAEWIGKQMDGLMAEYEKLKADDEAVAAEVQNLVGALDHHTVENRNKRKELQERRNGFVPVQNQLAESMRQTQKAMQQLYASVESALALAKHAEEWSWKEGGIDATQS
jgi:SMC interacting uncharacterized protein involved in chromosome segregation